MKYPLQDLLTVRGFREEKLAGEMTKRRAELADAQQAVEDRRRERDEYIEWRVKREEELYQEVMNQSLAVRDLDDLKLKIQLLRDDEVVYEQRILEAKNAVETAETNLQEAKAAHRNAVRDLDKIEQHQEMWAQEAAREHEANQEKELEDFRVRTLDGEE